MSFGWFDDLGTVASGEGGARDIVRTGTWFWALKDRQSYARCSLTTEASNKMCRDQLVEKRRGYQIIDVDTAHWGSHHKRYALDIHLHVLKAIISRLPRGRL